MYQVQYSKRFAKNLKLCQKRGLDMEAITRWAQKIIDDVLAEDEKPLEHVIK